ncbi:MAG: GGDEF domain-containing protein [Pseudomonadota bacterium]
MPHDLRGLLITLALACAAQLAGLAWAWQASGPSSGLWLAGIGLIASLVALAGLWFRRQRACDRTGVTVAQALNALTDAVIQVDCTGHPTYLNPAGEAMLGLGAGAAPPSGILIEAWRFVDRETRAPLLADLLARAEREGPVRIPDGARLINRYGLELEVEGLCQPLRDEQGQARHFLLHLRDITEQQEWRRQLPDLWDRDPVSGLPGARFLHQRLARALDHRRASDLPLALLYLGLDGVEAVYAREGAHAGDTLVRLVAARVRAHVRDSDLIARLDAACFVVLLSQCPAEVSERIASGIANSLRDFRFAWRGHEQAIAVCLGRVAMPPFTGEPEALIEAARRAGTPVQPL